MPKEVILDFDTFSRDNQLVFGRTVRKLQGKLTIQYRSIYASLISNPLTRSRQRCQDYVRGIAQGRSSTATQPLDQSESIPQAQTDASYQWPGSWLQGIHDRTVGCSSIGSPASGASRKPFLLFSRSSVTLILPCAYSCVSDLQPVLASTTP